MTRSRKNTGLAVAALVLVLAVLPFRYSEAQSAEMDFSASQCEQLGAMPLDTMSEGQMLAAKECDTVEATHDWERQYGGLNDEEMLAGIVYE